MSVTPATGAPEASGKALHVVVVGHGMVGARFAEEVRRLDPAGRRVRLTILAAEPRPAYNRVLLPSLLSGVMREEDFVRNGRGRLPGPSVDLRTGTPAIRLDPASQTISTSGAEHIRYDALVLATGTRAFIPPLPGVLCCPGGRPPGDPPAWRACAAPHTPCGGTTPGDPPAWRACAAPHTPCGDPRGGSDASGCADATARSGGPLAADVAVLHSLADARRIATLAQAARRRHGRIAVLGGGVLGLEAARALAARSTAVTVVHRGAHLMERQLDAPAGRVLAAAVRRTGMAVELGVPAARWESGRGLWLADGRLVPAAGLLLCTGTVVNAELARDAGLKLTASGAVAVDDTLATSEPGVYAIGDCAGHPGAAGGLVQPGWEQAAVLASRLTGSDPAARYRGSTAVTRLKAAGIELTCVGEAFAEPVEAGYEVLRFEDPARERYAKLVLYRDRVVGAIMIGLPDAAAGIVQLYDRGAPAPADRLALLLGRALPPESAAGPAALPDHAIVCRCNMVTKGQLRTAWYGGAASRAALSSATRAATGCGTCGDDLDAFTAWLTTTDPNQKEPALR